MNAGEIHINIIVNSGQATAGIQNVNVGLQGLSNTERGLATQNVQLSSSFQSLGLSLMSLQAGFAVVQQGIGIIKNIDAEYQKLIASNRVLTATSKLTGANFEELQKNSEKSKDAFQLNTKTANDLTIQMTKLTSAAGQSDKTFQSITALLNLGAAQGLDTEQTLTAISQAILGIDEGTDKLFQKNPEGIYKEYAAAIGTTVGAMTEQEKKQAILNAVLSAGEKLQGTYSERLTTTAGKQDILNNKYVEAQQKGGEYLQRVLNPMYDKLIESADANMKLASAMKKVEDNSAGAVSGARNFVNELLTFNAAAWGINQIDEALTRVMSHFSKAKEGLNNIPYGPELPPDFKRIGRGGEMEGIDYAGKSDLSKKTTSSKQRHDTEQTLSSFLAMQRAEEELAVFQRKQNEITEAQLKDIFASHLAELELKKNLIDAVKKNLTEEKKREESAKNLAEYKKAELDLQTKINGLSNTTFSLDRTKSQLDKSVVPGDPKHPGFDMGRGLIDYDALKNAQEVGRLPLSAMIKEVPTQEFDLKGGLEGLSSFTSGLKANMEILNIKSDTFLGTMVNAVDIGTSFFSNVLKMIESFSSGDGLFGFLKLGLSFIPGGGAAASAAGALSGGGGGGVLGGSFRPGNYQGNISKAISSESTRIIERPYITDFTGDGNKLRVVLKEVDVRRQKLNPFK